MVTTGPDNVYYDDDGQPVVDLATCGTCGRTWDDAIITGSTPAPSARCPFEYEHDELDVGDEPDLSTLRVRIVADEDPDLSWVDEEYDPEDLAVLGVIYEKQCSMGGWHPVTSLWGITFTGYPNPAPELEAVADRLGQPLTVYQATSLPGELGQVASDLLAEALEA